jgi:integrase
MKSRKAVIQGSLEKAKFGGIYRTNGSRFLYISFNYFRQRLRFATDREDTTENRAELVTFMNNVGEKIRNRTLQFDKVFYWLDDATKAHFVALEDRDYKPEPEHVLFSEYAEQWAKEVIPTFSSLTKRRDYEDVINSRLLAHFGQMTFAMITSAKIKEFIDNLAPIRGQNKTLSVKRVKHIITPLSKIWQAASNHYNWDLRYPFAGIADVYAAKQDVGIQQKEKESLLRFINNEEDVINTREVFLLEEWQRLLACVDPHYHLVMELLMMGMIGSELEGLMRQHIKIDHILVQCAVTRTKGLTYLKFKPKSWFRKRHMPLTAKLRNLLNIAVARPGSSEVISFDNDITIPASEFILTMKDGSSFNYKSFVKTVWNKAVKAAGLASKVPYSSRHSFVQWSLLIGVAKVRLVDLMGHSTKKMIDDVYGKYRQGLVEEREKILDYLGEDFLALEELKIFFPERYYKQMTTHSSHETTKAPALTATFGQSFGQIQGLYADNYLK